MSTNTHPGASGPHDVPGGRDGIDRDRDEPLVPLESLVANDARGAELRKLKDELATLAMRVRADMQRGMVADAYRDHAALSDAVAAATAVVEAVWEEQNAARSLTPLHS